MPIPHVEFSADSANAYDCVAWAARSIIAGELAAEARADLPAACRAIYRVADDLTQRIAGPQVWGDTPTDLELLKLADALGVAQPAAADSAAPGISPVVMQLMLRALMAILERYISE